FVLDRLRELSRREPAEQQELVDTALELGGETAAEFVVRCATDFPDMWRALNHLKPSRSGPATVVFAKAVHRLIAAFSTRERLAENASLLEPLRTYMQNTGDTQVASIYIPALIGHVIVAELFKEHVLVIDACDKILSWAPHGLDSILAWASSKKAGALTKLR